MSSEHSFVADLLFIPGNHGHRCFWALDEAVESTLMMILAELLMERPSTRITGNFDNVEGCSSETSANSLEILRGAAADAIALLLSPNLNRSPQRTQAQLVRIATCRWTSPHEQNRFTHQSISSSQFTFTFPSRAFELNRNTCLPSTSHPLAVPA